MFKSRAKHFIHLNLNSLWLKIEEVHHLGKSTNASVTRYQWKKLDASVLSNEVATEGYYLIREDCFRKGGL